MSLSDDHDLPTEELPAAEPRRPAMIKRRWAVFGKAGSGVVILATAGAIAVGTPGNGVDGMPASSNGGGQELSIDRDAGDERPEQDSNLRPTP